MPGHVLGRSVSLEVVAAVGGGRVMPSPRWEHEGREPGVERGSEDGSVSLKAFGLEVGWASLKVGLQVDRVFLKGGLRVGRFSPKVGLEVVGRFSPKGRLDVDEVSPEAGLEVCSRAGELL